MPLQEWFDRARQSDSNAGGAIRGAPQARGIAVTREEWRRAAEDMAGDGGRLLAHGGSRDADGDNIVRAAFIADAGVLVLSLPLTAAEADYPGIEQWFPSANRMQRAVADLSGLRAADADRRPWVRH